MGTKGKLLGSEKHEMPAQQTWTIPQFVQEDDQVIYESYNSWSIQSGFEPRIPGSNVTVHDY